MMEPSTVATLVAGKAFEAAATAVIERASPAILSKIAERMSKETIRLKVQFTKTFQDQLAASFERSDQIKTVISRDKTVSLEDIYVPLTLKCGEDTSLPDISADPSNRIGARYIISGTGGAGKTILMKHLLNISKSNSQGLVPLFIELRNLQFDAGTNLEDCIFKELKADGATESQELFQTALEEGLFVIYLDGFDEIHPEETAKSLDFIKRFSHKYKKTSILITTRPKTGVETLREFQIFHVEPLSKESAIELIEKTDFDQQTKEKFLNQIKAGLFEKHKTLMSLPILVGMMMISFRTYADIPNRMTVFYGQAFEALYSIHDSENKELFKRKHHGGLAPDVFKKVLQAFSYLSLANHDIEFSETTLQDYIRRALLISKVDINVEQYKNDLIHNVCVIQPDGLSYVFVHRSFQEYFASIFALGYSGNKIFDVMDQIISVSGSAVARMMLEIDPTKTKKYWLFPKVENFYRFMMTLKRRPIQRQIAAFFRGIFKRGDSEVGFSFTLGENGDEVFKIMELINECTGEPLGFGQMARHLTIPSEKEIRSLKSVKGVSEAAASKSEAYISFGDKNRCYPIEGEVAILFSKTSNFSENLSKYIRRLKALKDRMAIEVEAQQSLEDEELFG